MFWNQQAFDDPKSRLAATGTDLRKSAAITDPQGRVLAYAQTGGILSPTRYEIPSKSKLFRFGGETAGVARVKAGSWWLERKEFEKLLSFAQTWDLSVGMAMRLLCLVPPEWSDATLLVRARTDAQLLAWRGLANSVVTPVKTGGPQVRMPHQNDISERRVNQLFIPGLGAANGQAALVVEQDYPLSRLASQRGFLYL